MKNVLYIVISIFCIAGNFQLVQIFVCWLHDYRTDSIVQPKGEEEVEKEHILGCTVCTIRMKGSLARHLLTVAQDKRFVALHLSVKRLQYDRGVLYYACDISIARQDSGMGGEGV